MGSLLAVFTDPGSRTWWPWWLTFAAAALAVAAWRGERIGWRTVAPPALWTSASSRLDLQLLLTRRLLTLLGAGAGLGGAQALARAVFGGLTAALGPGPGAGWSPTAVTAAYTLALFVAWDASRWALHRAMHAWAPLWHLHQVHHAAEALTPLTFHRIHPLEGVLYGLRGAVVSGLLGGFAFWCTGGRAIEATLVGVNALGLLMNGWTGNLRHSHVWLPFPAAVERWLISPAQHQLHHADAPAWQQANFGTWLAVWDRLAGTLVLSPDAPPAVYGLRPADRSHDPRDLVSTLIDPVRAALGALRPPARATAALAALAALAVPRAGRAEPTEAAPVPPPAEPPPADDAVLDVLVVSTRGIPHEPGSAYVIGEEELARFGHDDIQRVLAKVPGVVVRGEDGYGLRPNIGMRGASSDRSAKITLLEDGIPLAPAPYAAPAAYYFPLAMRLTGIEVFKGPAALRQGPQTIGGAVNVLTRAVPDATSAAADLGFGSYDTLQAHAWAAAAGPTVRALFETAHLTSGGFKTLDGGGPTGFARQDWMLKARWAPAPVGDAHHAVTLKLGLGRERSNETYLGLTGPDFAADPYRRYAASANDLMTWERTQAALTWHALFGDRADLTVSAYHHLLLRTWTKLNGFVDGPDLHDLLQGPDTGQSSVYLAILRGDLDSTSPDTQLGIGTNDRALQNAGIQATAHLRHGRGRVQGDLAVGLRLHLDDVTRLQTEDAYAMTAGRPVAVAGAPTAVLLDSATSALAAAPYVIEDLALGGLHLQPGVRVEAVRTAAGTTATGPVAPVDAVAVLPGIGALAELAPGWEAFAGVHRGFSPVAPGSPAAALPETAWSWELGARAAPRDTHAELVGFFSDYDNLTGACTLSSGCDPAQVDQQFNGGRAWVYGVEALASQALDLPKGHRLSAEATGTWTQAQFRSSFTSDFTQFGSVDAGDALPYVPPWQGAIQLADDHRIGGLAVAVRARGPMRDQASQGPIDPDRDIPASAVVDASARLRVYRSLTSYVQVTNATDAVILESWRPFGARPAAPLQAMVGLKAGAW